MTTRANDRPVSIPARPPAPAGFVRPAHGGLLRVPWRPGENGNPQGKRPDEYLETIRLARGASPETMRKLIAKIDSQDERVAMLAMTSILDRAWGKPKDYDPKEAANAGLRFDIDALTAEERSVLLGIIRRGAVRHATGHDDTNATTLDAAATETPPA